MARSVRIIRKKAGASLPRVVKATLGGEEHRMVIANRARYRMPGDKVTFQIPDCVCTTDDLKDHMSKIFGMAVLAEFKLRAWTTTEQSGRFVYPKGNELIIDLEDKHHSLSPLTFTLCKKNTALEQRIRRLRKSSVCGICMGKTKFCDGMSCNP